MKIIFFGTSDFALVCLEALTKSTHKILSIITKPGKQMGRGMKIHSMPVEDYAKRQNLKRASFEDVNSEDGVKFLSQQKCDLFVVVDFGQILSKEVLSLPRLYSINVHGSLLPRYRGASPIQQAIINGDRETGITVIKISQSLDAGDIITQSKISIGQDEDTLSLRKRLAIYGAELLVVTLNGIESDKVIFIPQDDAKATYASKISKEDGLINWKRPAVCIRNQVRGSLPWPSAYTYFDGRLLKVLKADILNNEEVVKPGAVIRADKDGIAIRCGKSALLIKRLQLEGKRELNADEFLRGNPLPEGIILG